MKTKVVQIERIGKPDKISPLASVKGSTLVNEDEGVIYDSHKSGILEQEANEGIMFFELAGPRKEIRFDPKDVTCGIVTCGGLCPGLNDVIRAVTIELYGRYQAKKVIGFRYGYAGLTKNTAYPPIELTLDNVDDIHNEGGTMLASSRGAQDIEEMVDVLVMNDIKILVAIGGDGTIRGARDIIKCIKKRGLDIAVVAVPKTIDNDIDYVQMSFGFQTAVEESKAVIASAHIEAKGATNGVGLVKLMGRHSGFIAAYAALANSDVNYCLIPEVPFKLKGKGGLLEVLEERLDKKEHAVIVVAEGTGQDIVTDTAQDEETDRSGNLILKDIGVFLKEAIKDYYKSKNKEINVKYIDPSYMIRSVPANAMDSAYCIGLGQSAVHAAMSGRTNMVVGNWNNHFIHVPIDMAIEKRNKVNPNRRLWKTVMESTLQPESMFYLYDD